MPRYGEFQIRYRSCVIGPWLITHLWIGDQRL